MLENKIDHHTLKYLLLPYSGEKCYHPSRIWQSHWLNTSSIPCGRGGECIQPCFLLAFSFHMYLSSTDGEGCGSHRTKVPKESYPLPVHCWLTNTMLCNEFLQGKFHLVLKSFQHVVTFLISCAQVTHEWYCRCSLVWKAASGNPLHAFATPYTWVCSFPSCIRLVPHGVIPWPSQSLLSAQERLTHKLPPVVETATRSLDMCFNDLFTCFY